MTRYSFISKTRIQHGMFRKAKKEAKKEKAGQKIQLKKIYIKAFKEVRTMKYFKIGFLLLLVWGIGFMNCLELNAQAQVIVNIGQSSEWDASAFNNGRRVVRDTSDPNRGYIHYVWHSQSNPNSRPWYNFNHIYYACTDEYGAIVIAPTNLTFQLQGLDDNRYPSIAIEYGCKEGDNHLHYNDVHLVWQGKISTTGNYDIFHACLQFNGSPPVSVTPFLWTHVNPLSQTFTQSLVPSIAINNTDDLQNQHIHVAWQEEDININNNAAEICYTRSIDSGMTFSGPASGGLWDNITNTTQNSQMPSISCSLDYYCEDTTDPSIGCYKSPEVYVAYNEDQPGPGTGISIYYRRSPNDGVIWSAAQNVTTLTGGTIQTADGYPCLAVDMHNDVYIAFMRGVMQNDQSGGTYSPGFDPSNWSSFPGPAPGMYRILTNSLVVWSSNTSLPVLYSQLPDDDLEFPTLAFDREHNLTVTWQNFVGTYMNGYYNIYRAHNLNYAGLGCPPIKPVFGTWFYPFYESLDYNNDDYFPNLAHKKASGYRGVPGDPFPPNFTGMWTKIVGLGYTAATAAVAKTIFMFNSLLRDPAI